MQPPESGAKRPSRPQSSRSRSKGGSSDRRGGGKRDRGGRRKHSDRPVDVQVPEAKGETGFGSHGELLQAVSRTFFLSIKTLPEAVREPVALGYLVARATDTIADSAQGAPETRVTLLKDYVQLFKYGWQPSVAKQLAKEIIPGLEEAGEKRLLEETEALVAWFGEMPAFERRELLRVWTRIAYAQELDLVRFGEGKSVAALADQEALEDYTYLIAGCVGEFWTRLCAERCEGFSRQSLEAMEEKGRHFGQALQLINILRDYGKDLKAGRCYWPADQLAHAGVDPESLAANPGGALPVIAQWRERARMLLQDARDYVLAVDHPGIRLATALPVAIGSRTLTLLEDEQAALSGTARLSRGQIKWLIAQGWVASRVRPLLPKFLAVNAA